MVVLRRPPNRIAEIGTPSGFCHSGASVGTFEIGVQKRELGCAAGVPDSGVQSLPRQSMRWSGASSVMPSHHTPPSSVRATFVKMLPPASIAVIAVGFVV